MKEKTFLKMLLDRCIEGILVVDASQSVVYVNNLVAKLFGHKAEEVMGRNLDEMISENPSLRNILKNSEHEQFYDEYKVEREVLELEDEKYHVFRFFPLLSDNEAVNELIELNKELKAIYDSSYDGVFVTDGKGKTLRANQPSIEMCGTTADEIIGKYVQDLEKRKIFYPSVTVKVLKEKRPTTIIQNTKSGKQVMVTATPVFDSSGNISRVVSISKDMTELIKLKQKLEDQSMLVGRYRKELSRLRDSRSMLENLIVESSSFKQIIATVDRLAKIDTTILLQGESGVGKNVLARYIHQISDRRDGPFVEVNCGIFPENLIESELFGYEKGAFTGAKTEGKIGFVEIAHGGTLFLDEISEIPLKLQVKLLHFLQERKFMRVGSTKVIHVDCRIIAASNNDLASMVREGLFREDLYYRLNVFPIIVPPLRERIEAVPDLAKHFLEVFNRRYGFKKRFSEDALDELKKYHWPGNIRELRNLVERIVITSDSPEITRREVVFHLFPGGRLKEPDVGNGQGLKQALRDLEKRILKAALEREKNTYRLAEMLGISQSSVVKKIQKYGLRAQTDSN